MKPISFPSLLSKYHEARVRFGKVVEAKHDVKVQESFLSNSVEELKKLIEDGATTGDRLTDLVILSGGGVDPEIVHRFRSFEGRLAGKKGQLAAVEYTAQVPYRHTFGRGTECTDVNVVRLAIITDEFLSLGENEGLEFPSKRYVIHELPYGFETKSGAEEGTLFARQFNTFETLHLIEFILPPRGCDNPRSGLHVGDDEVLAFLKESRVIKPETVMDNVREELGQLVLRSETSE